MRIRGWLRRGCFATAAVSGVLAVVAPALAPAAPNSADTHPPQFEGRAHATAIQGEVNTATGEVVPEIFRPSIPRVDGFFKHGNEANSAAAVFDPGALGTKGLSLLCAAGFPCAEFPGFPPPYPLKAEAEYPFQPDAEAPANGQTFGEDPFKMTLGETTAHAGRDFVESRSVAKAVTIGATAGPETAVLRVGSAQASTTLSFPDPSQPNQFVVRAESRLSDVSALLGRLRFESVVSVSESRADGAGLVNSTASVKLKGATLDGHPFELSEKGVVIDGEPRDGGGLGQLGSGLDQLASQAHGSVTLLGVSNEKVGTTANGAASGVLVEYRIQPDPRSDGLIGHFVLGQAGTSSFVSLRPPETIVDSPEDFGGGDFTAPTDTGTPIDGPSATPAGTGETFATGGGDTEITTIEEPAEGGAAEAAPDEGGGGGEQEIAGGPEQPSNRRIGFLGGLAGERMKLFYLAWTLSLLGLALGSRARPVRLGTGR